MLNVTSCMAENADATCSAITHYLGAKLGFPTRFVAGMSWEKREALFDSGEIQVCWICGLPYVWKADAGCPAIELCAVPVMQDKRYQNRPVYFSDVVVHRDSSFHTFSDLRGASWAYNEPRSHSGYNVVRHHLFRLGEESGYFGRATCSGAHQISLEMIVARKIDSSAIDSTVLEAELRLRPEFTSQIRKIATLGPSPMPPWVMAKSVPARLRRSLCEALLTMHDDADGHSALQQWGISHFTAAADSNYDPIRSMAREAEKVCL